MARGLFQGPRRGDELTHMFDYYSGPLGVEPKLRLKIEPMAGVTRRIFLRAYHPPNNTRTIPLNATRDILCREDDESAQAPRARQPHRRFAYTFPWPIAHLPPFSRHPSSPFLSLCDLSRVLRYACICCGKEDSRAGVRPC